MIPAKAGESLPSDNHKKDEPSGSSQVTHTPIKDEPPTAVEETRHKSLSPMAQKMAMQNNAWKPPEYLQTTSSYIPSNAAAAPVAQDEEPRIVAECRLEPTSNADLSSSDMKREKKITPFVINKAKSSIADPENLNREHLDCYLPDAPHIQLHNTIDASISNSGDGNTINNFCQVPMTGSGSSARAYTTRLSSGATQAVNNNRTPGYPSVTPIVDAADDVGVASTASSAMNSSGQLVSDGSGNMSVGKNELDRAFENTMALRPQSQEDIEGLSVSLVVLSSRWVDRALL